MLPSRAIIAALLCLAAEPLPAQMSSAQRYIDAFWQEAASFPGLTLFTAAARGAVAERTVNGTSKPGSIHHIHGRLFVPGASLPEIIAKVRDYNSHSGLFKPILRNAALCAKESDDVFVFRYWATPYIDSVTETRAVHKSIDDSRYIVTSSTSALGSPGDLPDKKDLCKGSLPGVFYMKQLHAVWRYEQTASGVRIEADAVAELGGFALVRSTAKRVLAQIMSQSLDQYRLNFAR
jgi:hypothetical protein